MNDYERKAIERCVRPVQMAIDALSLPPREDEPDERPCPRCGSPVVDGHCEDVGGHFCQYTREEDICRRET